MKFVKLLIVNLYITKFHERAMWTSDAGVLCDQGARALGPECTLPDVKIVVSIFLIVCICLLYLCHFLLLLPVLFHKYFVLYIVI